MHCMRWLRRLFQLFNCVSLSELQAVQVGTMEQSSWLHVSLEALKSHKIIPEAPFTNMDQL